MVRYHEILKETDEKEILKRELEKYYDINLYTEFEVENGVIKVLKGAISTKDNIEALPNIRIEKITDLFQVYGSNVRNLINSPLIACDDVHILYNPLLESLKGLPKTIGGFEMQIGENPNLSSLEDLEKTNFINKEFLLKIELYPRIPVLKLLLFKNLKLIGENQDVYENLMIILNKYRNDTSMPLYEKQMRCQHELLGYPEYRLNAKW